MAYICVNTSKLRSAADSIERYVQLHRQQMQHSEASLVDLHSSWSGVDYQQLMIEWDQMSSNHSVSGNMLRALENQVKDLRWAAKEYDKAKNRALSRAKRLK